MTPAARIQATIELLEALFDTARPADNIMAFYFKQRRYIGSKDKAAISEQFYHILRNKLTLEYVIESAKGEITPRNLLLTYLLEQDLSPDDYFGEGKYAPRWLSEEEQACLESIDFSCLDNAPKNVRLNIPAWIEPLLQNALGDNYEAEANSLLTRAATDIRVNLLKTDRQNQLAAMKDLEFDCFATQTAPHGIRFKQRVGLFGLKAFQQGLFEVQDEGSQLLAHLVGARAGQKVVDYCAGAGGKTLAMSATMQNKGVLYACDVHDRRLSQLAKRAKRAGAHNIRIQHLNKESKRWINNHHKYADTVLVDAPCSGTGTWRRSPDARWNLSEQTIQELIEKQRDILTKAASLVKPGGQLFYATCSLLLEENEQQIDWFINEFDDFQLGELDYSELDNLGRCDTKPHQLRTYSARSDMDGFYVCVLRRRI
jgi:16S rRNA (cytosine967-C5)-methyltransferase